jgi:hypothetical protein
MLLVILFLRNKTVQKKHFDPTSPIRRDNGYLKSCSKRKGKY